MGNSRAYPILHTPDVDRALDVVDNLLKLGDLRDLFLRVGVRTQRATGLPRYLDTFGSWLDPDGPGELEVYEPSGLATAAPPDPADPSVSLHLQVGGRGPVEDLVRVIGRDPAFLVWAFWGWPEVPDLDLGMDVRDAHVGLTLNASDMWGDEPAEHHTVFVHTRWHQRQRAEWLAGQVGLTVIGEGELGF